MFIVIYTLLLLACSTALSVVTFLVGRCGRRLPLDGTLPRVVHSARFDREDDCSGSVLDGPSRGWPYPT
jgi:hypothetical protein